MTRQNFTRAHSTPAPSMAAQLRALTAACPHPAGIMQAFGGPAAFARAVNALNRFPALPQSPLATNRDLPHEAHAKFAKDCVAAWRPLNRPGLPHLAQTLLADKGIDSTNIAATPGLAPQEQALARAVMLLAARAETNRNNPHNAYHNPVHTAHVATAAGYLGDLNDQLVEGYGRFVEYTIREKLLILAAAFAHDIDHPGAPNPAHNPAHNEQSACAATLPLLKAAGVHPRDCARFETMLLTTSPDGPHKVLKAIAHAHAHRELVNTQSFKNYPELGKILCADRELTQMAAILADSDIFASVLNLAAAHITGHRLTQENKKAGLTADFTTAQSRAAFITNVVGRDGYASQAARAGFNPLYRRFVAANDEVLKNPKP